jgi:hypothetical protein
MEKGSLATFVGDTIVYTQPIGVTDQVGAIRHHAGFARKGEHCLVLSKPGEWKETPELGISGPWTQILLGGQVVWARNHYLAVLMTAA